MSINIYVGNLSFDANEGELKGLFEEYGAVDTVKIISDQFTGRSSTLPLLRRPSCSLGTCRSPPPMIRSPSSSASMARSPASSSSSAMAGPQAEAS